MLQEDLEQEQVRVNSLTHMVVVVDESSGDCATAALESKLQVIQSDSFIWYTSKSLNKNTFVFTSLENHYCMYIILCSTF